MPRENAATKGRRYLVEGRVILTDVGEGYVRANVRGEGAMYHTAYSSGTWSCTCPAVRDCAHIRALKCCTAPEPELSR